MSRSPLLRLYDHEYITDNFAGGGGASEGIRLGVGRDPDIAVNHDPEALAMHRANHPNTHHMEGSVWDVDPTLLMRGRKVGLAWFSPDCFPAGTLILTRAGYRPIETITEGDEVLTHKQRWRCVTATMRTRKPLVQIRGHEHPGLLVSAEHPFLVRQTAAKPGATDHQIANEAQDVTETWVRAGDVGHGSFWASPARIPTADEVPLPTCLAGSSWAEITSALFVVGRVLGEGHIADDMSDLARWFVTHFGLTAETRTIPGWLFGVPHDLRSTFLDGVRMGTGKVDMLTRVAPGAVGAPFTEVRCTKAFALGLHLLATSIGRSARLIGDPFGWAVRIFWREPHYNVHAFNASGLRWTSVKGREDDAGEAEVFNLSVEEDESYVADGLVVHNCTFHSRARGGKPFRDPKSAKGRRGLAWVVTRWARAVRPRVLAVENVSEFEQWGPLGPDNRPDPERAGLTFRRWVGHLRNLGYSVEWRELRACDYGAPTSRKRLFILARCDGHPIMWPEPTHGPGRAHPYRTAAECIDWSLPVPSIFERDKPLADATLARIVRGIMKFVVEEPSPFLVKFYGTSSVQSVDDPLGTVTANGLHYAVTTPYLVPLTHQGDARVHPLGEPFRTITGANRGEVALAVPTLIQTGYGERAGQAPRALNIHAPLGTAVAGGVKHALGAVFLARHYGGNYTGAGAEMTRPLPTITTIDHHAVVTAAIAKRGNHAAEVRALLERFAPTMRGAVQGDLFSAQSPPLGTVHIGGETFQIVDIGMRMLSPRELFNAQGFRPDYIIDPEIDGVPLSKTAQVRMCGNSVPPQMAAALVRANLGAAMELAA